MKFTIRDLLWLTLLAVAAAWWVDRSSSADERERVRRLAEQQRAIKNEIALEQKRLRETEIRLRAGWGKSLIDRTGFTPSELLKD